MLYDKGTNIIYKGYKGKIRFVFEYNKTYIVTLYNYRGHKEIDRQVDQHEIYEQMCLC